MISKIQEVNLALDDCFPEPGKQICLGESYKHQCSKTFSIFIYSGITKKVYRLVCKNHEDTHISVGWKKYE